MKSNPRPTPRASLLLAPLLLAAQFHALLPARASAQEAPAAAAQEAAPARREAAADEPARQLSHEGSMIGADARRSRVFKTRALREPKSLHWQSQKLFVMGGGHLFSVMGPFRDSPPGSGWASSRHFFEGPILAGDTLHFSLYINDGYLFAIDRETGKDRWRLRVKGGAFSSPAAAGGLLFYATDGGTFGAVEAATGREVWKLEGRGRGGSLASPAVADGLVYFSVTEIFGGESQRPAAKLYAFDAKTGADAWESKAAARLTSPAVAGDTLYVGGSDGRLRALDARTGRERWTFKADAGVRTPAVAGATVYFADTEGRLYAVGGADGKLVWKSADKTRARTWLALDGDALYFAGAEGLHALDAATGHERWFSKTDAACNPPTVAEDFVYATCAGEFVYALDAKTGQVRWRFKQEKAGTSAPLVADGVMYLLRADGYA